MAKLATKEILKKIPKLYETDGKPKDQVKVHLKIFNPYGSGTWYITEFDGDQTCFGYTDLNNGMAELGYINLKELEDYRNKFGWKFERDLYWNSNTTLKQVMDGEVK